MPRVLLFVFAALTFAFAQSASAQSENAVVVATFGGVQELPVRDLAPDNSVISLGKRRIVPFGEDVRIADIKILPDGSHILADVNGRGVAVTPPNGQEYNYVLDPQLRMTSVRAASVASYFSPGQPSIIGLADSASQFGSLREVSTNEVLWFETFRLGINPADIVQIITMPFNRVGVAVNWTSLDLSVIDVYDIQTLSDPVRLANRDDVDQPPDTIIVPELQTLRDIMFLEDDTFLVATRYTVLNVSRDGTVNWSIDIGSSPELGGEFSSARMLPSGHIVASTYQPGEWSRPHANHRVHWIDGDTHTLIASSDVFLSAPIRVEPEAGTGGTGTFGFTSGLDEIGEGDPDEVSLLQIQFGDSEIEVGDRLNFAATVNNGGNALVGLATLLVEARRGSCDEDNPAGVELGRAEAVALSPNATFTLRGDPVVTSTFGVGAWCATARFEDTTGEWHDLGGDEPFTIVTQKTTTNSTIDKTELPFNPTGVSDMGGNDGGGDMGGSGGGGGGCCRTIDAPNSPYLLLFIAFVFLRTRRKK